MEEIYLYGAGINLYGVIKYLNDKRVIGIIDSNPAKIGLDINGIPIISLEQYIREGDNRLIVISAYQKGEEVGKSLQKCSIRSFLIAPYMQAGFPQIEEIIKHFKLEQLKNIVFSDDNLLTFLLLEYLSQKNMLGIVKGIVEEKDKNYLAERFNLRVIPASKLGKNEELVITEQYCRKFFGNDIKKINLFEYIHDYSYCISKELLQFKDIHRGKRCFIIGTGSSLRMEDLDKLKQNKEICFASNKIFLSFSETEWRPDYYTICDFHAFKNNYDIIKKLDNMTIFIAEYYNMDGLEKIDGAYNFHTIHQKEDFRFSLDIAKNIYSGLTVTYDMLQIAAYMGFSEIYLLGIDFSYYMNSAESGKRNYFCDGYEEKAHRRADIYPEESFKAYAEAEKISREQGFRIYNATRGGKLEIFERVDFDRLFENV